MRHPRVRRPFIVESRGSSRDGGSVAIPRRVQPAPQSQQALQSASRPLFDPWAAVTTPAPAHSTAERRILPNIMEAPEPVPAEPEVEIAVEAPLPRVRRVKPRAAAAPRPAAPPVVVEAPAAPAPVPVAAPKPLSAAPRLSPRDERSARAALPAGQRWKARLPRACW